MHPQHAVQVDERFPVLSVPGPSSDWDEVAVAHVLLAGELYNQKRAGLFGGHDQNRSILALSVVFLVWHPRPDDLAGVRIPVQHGGVRHAHSTDFSWVHLHRAVRTGATRRVGSAYGLATRRRDSSGSPASTEDGSDRRPDGAR